MQLRAQGATEYLVLLAVVLVIALVGIALLGFFPGTASDAQIAESQIYWRSAGPISITESAARFCRNCWIGITAPYMRIRNVGPYRIQITKVFSGNESIAYFYSGGDYLFSTSPYYSIAPGEERYIGYIQIYGISDTQRLIYTELAGGGHANSHTLSAALSDCSNATTSAGTLILDDFGFEYIQYVEGQQIAKRQLGSKPLIIKCREPF